MNFRNKIRNTRNFSMDLSEVNEQSDDELSNRRFNNLNSNRNSVASLDVDRKKLPKLNNSIINERKVKFSSACDDSDSNEDHKEVQNNSNDGSDSQYESQDSTGSLKTRNISDSNEKCIDTIEVITDDSEYPRKMSVIGSGVRNRRDSRVQIFEDPDSGVKFSIQIIFHKI